MSTRSASYVYACLFRSSKNMVLPFVKTIDDAVALGADTINIVLDLRWFYGQC